TTLFRSVTDVPGTTRDIIEEYVQVKGVPLRLVDTAGIRETEDIVEKIGVERSRQVLGESDLILLVLNNNELLTDEDVHLFEAVKGLEVIVLINKIDLPRQLDMKKVEEDRKSTRLNSSHVSISYAVFCF